MHSTPQIYVDRFPALPEGSSMQPAITIYPCGSGWAVSKGQSHMAVLPSRPDAEAFAILVLDGEGVIQVLDSDGLVSGLVRRTMRPLRVNQNQQSG